MRTNKTSIQFLFRNDHEYQNTNDSLITITSCKKSCSSGVYQLKDPHIIVYCEKNTLDGGWLVIQQRVDLTLNFRRNWTEYRNGFGVVGKSQDFWLGLESIHQITTSGEYELAVEFKYHETLYKYARYSQFLISGESDKYRLMVGGHCGTLEDYFSVNDNTAQFSTYDSVNGRCRDVVDDPETGGWWNDRFCGEV